jgi:carbon-monoxide dehydrogenase medium subunit
MYAFALHRPTTLSEAVSLLNRDSDAKLLSGGQTLLPVIKQRLANPSALIDLTKVPDLKGIVEEPGALRIGAFTRHADVAESDMVRKTIPVLAALAGAIGDPHVRNMGTMGGSIANADPAADYPAAILALKARIRTDRREIDGDGFFKGLFETALQPGELIVSVRFEMPEKAAYVKFDNPASRFALVGVLVAKYADGIRVGVTGAAPSAFRATDLERALSSSFTPGAVTGVKIDPGPLNSDLHASADYRAHLIAVATKRAVEACT